MTNGEKIIYYKIDIFLSNERLGIFANILRSHFKVGLHEPFDVISILDRMTVSADFGDFDYIVQEDDCELFGKNEYALCDCINNIIHIKESVYNDATNNKSHGRFTITHELVHLILYPIVKDYHVQRVSKKPNRCHDLECRVDCLAGMLLVPADGIIGLTVPQIMDKYLVSEACVVTRLAQIKQWSY